MKSALPEDFWARAEKAAVVVNAQPGLAAAVVAEVNGFFVRYPNLQRTEFTAAFITALVIERLSTTAADSQSAAQPHAETKKVA